MLVSCVMLVGFVPGVSAQSVAAGSQVLYVDGSAVGPTHDGSGWCSGFLEVHEALAVAVAGSVIRVAGGTYHPDSSGLADPRDATFTLMSGVVIEGGYAGCGEVDPDLRDWVQFETILSGDLLDNDGPVDEFRGCCRATFAKGCANGSCEALVCAVESNCCSLQWQNSCVALAESLCPTLCAERDDNALHVVTGSGVDATAVLDGFVVSNGQADRDPFGAGGQDGAGMVALVGSPTISNCTFRDNDAKQLGGGVFLEDSVSSFVGCTFDNNTARNYFTEGDGSGGGAYIVGGGPVFSECLFTRGRIDDFGNGAGISATGAALRVLDSWFEGNIGEGLGAGISAAGEVVVERCVFLSNWSGVSVNGLGAGYIRDSMIIGNEGSGAFLQTGEMTNTVVAGNYGVGFGTAFGQALVANCTIVGNMAFGAAGGLVASNGGEMSVVNSIVWGNKMWASPDPVHAQIGFSQFSSGTIMVSNCDVEGGLDAVDEGIGTLVWGAGNIDADPLFLDPLGADGLARTEDDDFRLGVFSPCMDAGDNASVPAGLLFDLVGAPRIVDGDMVGGDRVDMGAYETPPFPPIPALSGAWLVALIFGLGIAAAKIQRRRAESLGV
jgi:Right handed beta helix region